MKNLLILLISFHVSVALGQSSPLESDGLKVYPFNLDSTDPNDLSYLDSIIQPFNIIALAEYHWSETTLKEEKKIIIYLSLKRGLDKIVIERPYAYGYWINEYLETGDTVLLRTVTDKFWTFDYYNTKSIRYVNYYEFYKWLFVFKKENNLSFDIIGIDLDQSRNGSLELWSLKHFIDKYALAHRFPLSYSVMEQLCIIDQPKFSELKKWLKTFIEELANQKKIINADLENDYAVFIKMVKGIEDVLNYGKNHNSVFRENNLADNFIAEVDSTDIVFAQFGHVHLLRASGTRHKALKGFDGGFISKVEDNPKFTSRVLSIYFLCKGCKTAGRATYHPGFFGQKDYDKIYNSIGDESVLIDFRNAKNEFADIPNSFQMSIFINGNN